MEVRRMKIVYLIADRNSHQCFSQIGVAFVDSDGSMNVKLEAIPLSGELLIRDYVPRHELAARYDHEPRQQPAARQTAVRQEPDRAEAGAGARSRSTRAESSTDHSTDHSTEGEHDHARS